MIQFLKPEPRKPLVILVILLTSASAFRTREIIGNSPVCLSGDFAASLAACTALTESFPSEVFLPNTTNYTIESTGAVKLLTPASCPWIVD